ncbi:MAG TPA: hypothetical protein VG147_02355 [Solirubrobacteraceae bacterium]|nr:hypothetical protein [Solirubrobacteraceae bacterium]
MSLHRHPAIATIVVAGTLSVVSPTWIWMQIAIVVFVVIGMIIAITKLA